MKRFAGVILSVLLIGSISLSAQEKRALLIGIGQYAPETGWHQIHGDNDVAITRSVLLKNGFSANNIRNLVNEEATFESIDKAIQSLLAESKKKDIIYIQFSGHGQQITDLDGDEEDGLDECWIPYDAGKTFISGVYSGQRHFTDDRLFGYLSKLRSRIGSEGKIIVISDACHSGSGSRGEGDDIFFRGTDEKFVIPGAKATHTVRRSPENDVQWLFVAACKSYQTNYEHRLPTGQYCGSLTYVISEDQSDFLTTPYSTLIDGWKERLQIVAKFPQSIEEEGKPNRRSNYLF